MQETRAARKLRQAVAKVSRQAADHDVVIDSRTVPGSSQRVRDRHDGCVGKRPQVELRQSRIAGHYCTAGLFDDVGHDGSKPDLVANALLPVNRDSFARQRLTGPLRLEHGCGQRMQAVPQLVTDPALCEVAIPKLQAAGFELTHQLFAFLLVGICHVAVIVSVPETQVRARCQDVVVARALLHWRHQVGSLDSAGGRVLAANQIDWARVGVPQEDGYDTEITEQLALERYGWTKKWPGGEPTWLHGGVQIIEPACGDELREPASATHPNLKVAENILSGGYPAMYRQCRQLLQKLYIYELDNVPIEAGGVGVSCGPMGDHVSFEISVTVNGGIGIIEGVVHELAHNKMKAHGISFHHWERLVMKRARVRSEAIRSGDGPNLYGSSVRKGYPPANGRVPLGALQLSLRHAYAPAHAGRKRRHRTT